MSKLFKQSTYAYIYCWPLAYRFVLIIDVCSRRASVYVCACVCLCVFNILQILEASPVTNSSAQTVQHVTISTGVRKRQLLQHFHHQITCHLYFFIFLRWKLKHMLFFFYFFHQLCLVLGEISFNYKLNFNVVCCTY